MKKITTVVYRYSRNEVLHALANSWPYPPFHYNDKPPSMCVMTADGKVSGIMDDGDVLEIEVVSEEEDTPALPE